MGYLWYGSCLSEEEEKIYRLLSSGIDRGENEIKLPKWDLSRISAICEQLRLDDPMRFCVDSLSFRSVRGEGTVWVIPKYSFEKKARTQMQEQLKRRILRIVSPWEHLSVQDAICAMHEWILANVVYDKIRKNYSHEVIGVLHHGIGVCEGISKTVKVFCDFLDIPCMVAIGYASSEAQRHAWNLICVEGEWKHYDFTFDLSAAKYGGNTSRYFSMTEEEAMKSRRASDYPFPR